MKKKASVYNPTTSKRPRVRHLSRKVFSWSFRICDISGREANASSIKSHQGFVMLCIVAMRNFRVAEISYRGLFVSGICHSTAGRIWEFSSRSFSSRSFSSRSGQYGLSPHSLKWMKSFLANRSQRVKVGNMHSEWATLSCGIPEGTVLGPTLFLGVH